jgi:hypothetical protein
MAVHHDCEYHHREGRAEDDELADLQRGVPDKDDLPQELVQALQHYEDQLVHIPKPPLSWIVIQGRLCCVRALLRVLISRLFQID